MLRTAALLAFLTVLGIILVDIASWAFPFRRRLHLAAAVRTLSVPLRLSRIAVNTIAFVSFAAAAITGFSGVFQKPGTLTGYTLLFHTIAAGTFAASSVVLTLFWIERNRFSGSEWRKSVRLVLRKMFFWAALALAVPTIVSVMLPMFPLPTPSQQEFLFTMHRCCAVALVTAGVLFTWFALMSWRHRAGD